MIATSTRYLPSWTVLVITERGLHLLNKGVECWTLNQVKRHFEFPKFRADFYLLAEQATSHSLILYLFVYLFTMPPLNWSTFLSGAPAPESPGNNHSTSLQTRLVHPTQRPMTNYVIRARDEAVLSQRLGILGASIQSADLNIVTQPQVTAVSNPTPTLSLSQTLVIAPQILLQVSTLSVFEMIAKKKPRLYQAILLRQMVADNNSNEAPSNPATNSEATPATSVQRPASPVAPNNAPRIVDAIGSGIRSGQPYVDVTQIPGIETVEDEPPRNNRGGHSETFPEVSHHTISPSLLKYQGIII
jgi:hypothetical protein